ncbi:MAG: hypothetical protein RIS75_81 [Actinomycetota bacterium]
MQAENFELLNVEHVLEISGISRGSLYHHFEDFSELLEAAEIEIFSIYVDLTIEKITSVVQASTSREVFIERIKKVTRATQNPDLTVLRAQRIGALARATGNERFRKALGLEQQRLTDSLADLFREAQEKELSAREYDTHAAAVFIQAYTIGRAIDDIAPHRVDPEAWYTLIDSVVENFFVPRNATS